MTTSRREFLGMTAGAWLGAGTIGQRDDRRAPEPKTILMLGGTGFLGPQTVEAALRRGHKVTLFNRGKTRPGLFPDLEKLQGDREKDDLKALEGRKWDAVVDTSANVPRWVKKAAAVLGPNVGHYIYISSISVYADTSKPGIDESAPVATIDDPTTEKIDGRTYGALKALTEKAAETAMPGKVAVVRPGLIVGPEDPSDRFTYWPVRVARGGEVLAPGSPDDPIQLIDVRDLGEFLVRLIEGRTTGVFNALGPRPGADDGPDARGLQAGRPQRRDLHLGRRRVPGEAGRPRLERHAGLGAQRRRDGRLREGEQRARHQGGPDVPPDRRYGQGHAGLVPDPARGPPLQVAAPA